MQSIVVQWKRRLPRRTQRREAPLPRLTANCALRIEGISQRFRKAESIFSRIPAWDAEQRSDASD